MQKAMVFIDYKNFNISLNSYYRDTLNGLSPSINYCKLSQELVNKVIIEADLIKTLLFAPKPCTQLLNINKYRTYYAWLNGLKNKPYFGVIEGTEEIRPVNNEVVINLTDTTTYKTEEKGTDINIAVHMISKAFLNSYDIGILVSGDSDYIPVVKTLHQLGKTVVLATLPNQNISKYDSLCDQKILLTNTFLQSCLNNNQKKQFVAKQESHKSIIANIESNIKSTTEKIGAEN